MKHYDAIIIGGGGGLKLRPISELGLKVAVIEKEDLGGTCLNRGCIPSKMLIHPADLVHEFKNVGKFDLSLGGDEAVLLQADFEAMVQRVTESVMKSSAGIAQAYAKNENVDFYHGHGRFVSNKVVEVESSDKSEKVRITADRIFVGTGSRPSIPPIDGLEGTPYMTSREALRNTKLPKSMTVIGGGYTAMELGYFYSQMGTEVTYLVRSGVLKREDEEIREEFLKAFPGRDNVILGVSPVKIDWSQGGDFEMGGEQENSSKEGALATDLMGKFTVQYAAKYGVLKSIESEALFVVTGVRPNSDDLGLENTSIETDKKGNIVVDEFLQTGAEGVFALGDVIGHYLFRHSVNFQGEYLMKELYGGENGAAEKRNPIVYPAMPHAVFSNPQIGGVGQTEKELEESGVSYVKGVNSYKESAMGGDVLMEDHGLVKLLFERESERLVGAHIVGREASSMIHICIAYLNMGATLTDMLEKTIYIHPAFPEVIRNACRKARKALKPQ
jgi:mycothione reductase